MGVITKLAVRNMKRRKARYILTTVTLVIGVALFGGILIANDSFQVTFINDIDRRMGTADILLRSTDNADGWFDEDDLEDIEGLDHITSITYRIAGFDVFVTSVRGGSTDDNSTLTAVYGIDPDSDDEADLGGTLSILDSDVDGKSIEDLLEDADDDQIVITESLKIKLGKDFEAGDKVYILPIDFEKTESEGDLVFSDSTFWPKYEVLAIVRDNGEARDFDPDTPEEFSSPSRGPCIFTTIDTAHDLVDGEIDHSDEFNLAAIGVDDLNIIEDVIDDIEHELDNDDWVAADLKTDSVEDINNSMTMMRTMFLMFALIALILSIILILNIFNIIKEEQEYETGMLQAIGSSKAETFKMFLMQGLIMGVLGAILGTVGSYFMSYFIFWMTIESLRNLPGGIGEYFADFEFSIILYPQTIAITLAVGVISCILASIYPSWKASRKPIIECLNPLAQKTKREKKHFERKILVGILASLFIIYGTYLLFSVMGQQGPGADQEASTISMVAPTMILLGIIGIMNLFVSPLTRVFIKLFGPYLKHTKLLTRKNVLRHRKRTILTFSMISLTTSYLIGLSVFMGSMSEGVETTVNDVMGCDVRIFSYGTSLDFADNLEDQDGVDAVMGVTYQNVQILDDDEWVGHGLLEKEWDVSVTANVVEEKMIKKRMAGTLVLDPSDTTFEEVMDDLKHRGTVMIPIEVADEFGLDEGDTMRVKFSLGIDYPDAYAMRYRDVTNAVENTIEVELEVIAVVDKVQGFGFSNLIGEDVESYSIFISWNTWEAITLNKLYGGGTDIMFRQKPQSGDPDIDSYLAKWFNFSNVIGAIENVSGIDYYTTRMDYISPTYNLNKTFDPSLVNFDSSVVGIRTNSSGKLKDDSYFGRHELVEYSDAYNDPTMEELLNDTSLANKVCVIDESYAKFMRVNDTNFGIGSNISIFPQLFNPYLNTINTGILNTSTLLKNGTVQGLTSDLTLSDNVNMTFTSNKTSLELNITINMLQYLMVNPFFLNPYDITIESSVNSTIDYLNFEVYNYNTKHFDNLGNISNPVEKNQTFIFNQYYSALSYIDQATSSLKLRIIGENSTFNDDYSLNVDRLSFRVNSSAYPLDPTYWPNYTVVGIIKDPTLAITERAIWSADVEKLNIVEYTKNTVYINYEDARNDIYPMNKGTLTNGTFDEVTSVLIHCNNIEEIDTIYYDLKRELNNLSITEFGDFTAIDLKTPLLETRRYVFDWFIWIKEGFDDEEVLEDLIEYIEDHGYIVLFGFTRTFVEDMFKGMINLIVMITTGVLTFAVIISMIGLALHSLLSTMARRREIGMLRSIGLNKKGVIRTISGETIIISLLGAFIGILAGLLQGFLMVSAVPDTGLLAVTFTIPWLTIGILIGVTLATAILSSRYPSRWAANINIIDAVRTR